MDRFFIVFYTAHSKDGVVNGNVAASTQDGKFISRNEFISLMNKDYGYTSVAITGISEVPYSDFSEFVK